MFTGLDLALLLDLRAAERREHPLLGWAPFDTAAQHSTYARFAGGAARLRGALAARGVRAGDRVLVHLENCPEALLARFACARVGAICVATNAMLAASDLRTVIEASNAIGVITQTKFASLFEVAAAQLRWRV